MRLLVLHLNRLAVEAAQPSVEEVDVDADGAPAEIDADTCVGAFVGVEPDDGADTNAVAAEAAAELREAADQLRVEQIALVPCPHLADDAASHETAGTVLEVLADALAGDCDVSRAPAGWHLAVDLSCKAHPFSVRSLRVDARAAAAPADENEWLIVSPDGERRTLEDLDRGDPPAALAAVVAAETESTGRPAPGDTADLFARRGLTSGGDADDGPRWLPPGATLRAIALARVETAMRDAGAVPVETPAPGDPAHETTGADSLLADRRSANLPASVYETDSCAAPADVPGETATLPAMHTAVPDLDAARDAVTARVGLASSIGEEFGLERVPVVRVDRAFHEDHRDWLEALVAALGTPTPVAVAPDLRWPVSLEYRAVAGDGEVRETGWIRLDRVSDEAVGAEGDDEADAVRSRYLVRCAPVGGLEQAIAAALASASDRDPPALPTWLAPAQVRLVPIDAEHLDAAVDAAAALREGGVRADVDDRDLPVGRRLDRADRELVPYVAVVGDRELEGDDLAVSVRATGREERLEVDGLRERVLGDVGAPDDVSPGGAAPGRLPLRVGDYAALGGE